MWPLRSQMASTQHRSSDHTLEGRFQGAIRDRASAFLGRNLLLYLYLAATSARTEHTFIEVSIASGHFSKPVLAEFSRGEASWSRLPRCCQARGCGAVRCGGAVEVRPCAAPAQLPRSAPALSSRTQLPRSAAAHSSRSRSSPSQLAFEVRRLGFALGAGAFASAAFSAGAVASAAVASGAVASGAVASGAVDGSGAVGSALGPALGSTLGCDDGLGAARRAWG